MAKLAITFLAVLLLVANAYAHRTTVTTIEIDEVSDHQSRGRCRRQIEKTDLSHCERFITQSRGQEIKMVSDEENPSSRSIQRCCGQMQELDDMCQCKALKYMVEGQQEGQMRGHDGQQQMMKRAQAIVAYCRLPQRCQ